MAAESGSRGGTSARQTVTQRSEASPWEGGKVAPRLTFELGMEGVRDRQREGRKPSLLAEGQRPGWQETGAHSRKAGW